MRDRLMKQIEIYGLGVKELTDKELTSTDGGSFLNSIATTIGNFFADIFKLDSITKFMLLSFIGTIFPE